MDGKAAWRDNVFVERLWPHSSLDSRTRDQAHFNNLPQLAAA
jgi:hypothetical protein